MILSQRMALSLVARPGSHPAFPRRSDQKASSVEAPATGPARHVAKLFSRSNTAGDHAVCASIPTRTASSSNAVARVVRSEAASDQPWVPGASRPARERPVARENPTSTVRLAVLSGPASGSRDAGVPHEARLHEPLLHAPRLQEPRLRAARSVSTGPSSIPRALQMAGVPRRATVPGPAAPVPASSGVPDRAGRDTVVSATVAAAARHEDVPGHTGRGVGALPALLRAGNRRDQTPADAPSWQLPSPESVPDATTLAADPARAGQGSFTSPAAGSAPVAGQPSWMIPMSGGAASAAREAGVAMELQRRVVPPPTPIARPPASSAASAGRQWLGRPSDHDPGQQAPDGQGAFSGTPLVVHLTGDVMLDGRRLGQLTASSQARQASLPSHGTSRVDLRAVPIYSGAQVPR